MKKATLFLILQIFTISLFAQINTDRVLAIGRNALYFEDYVLSIQYFNQVIRDRIWTILRGPRKTVLYVFSGTLF